MELIVDGDKSAIPAADSDLAMSTLETLSQQLHDQGRAIVKVLLDGADIPHSELAKTLGDRSVDSVSTLEIRTEPIDALIGQVLADLENTLPGLSRACHDLAQVFQSEAPHEGFEPFQNFADIWGYVKERQMQIAGALDLDLGTCAIKDKSLNHHHDTLNNILEEAARAIEQRDTVLLGDLLEYELSPLADLELEIVALLKEHASKRSA
jgi:hypothetical protein